MILKLKISIIFISNDIYLDVVLVDGFLREYEINKV